VADGHRGVAVQEHERQGLAHDVAAAHDDGLFPLDGNPAAVEQFDHPQRRAGPVYRAPGEEAPDVDGVEPVDVLAGVDRLDDHVGIDVLRQGQLHEDAVDLGAGIEPGYDLPEALLRRLRGQPVLARQEAGLGGGLFLAAHVDLRGGVFAHEDHGQARRNPPFFFQFESLRPHFRPHLPGDPVSVNHFGHRLIYPFTIPTFQYFRRFLLLHQAFRIVKKRAG